MKYVCIALVFATSFISCEKVNHPDVDHNYPTTINEISADAISQLRSEYHLKNRYMVTSLNNFGFCGFFDNATEIEWPPITGPLSQQEAIGIVENFALLNKSHTGISSFDDVQFAEISSSAVSSEGSSMWSFETNNQYIDTLEVLDTKIIFMIKNSEMYWCVGNWYPEIYIPKSFNFNSENAKTVLVGRVVTHLGWADSWDVTITPENLSESEVRLVIKPLKYDDRIEIRVAWEVLIPYPVNYRILVDVIFGDIVYEEPTIIS
jgi:hypothetical protein